MNVKKITSTHLLSASFGLVLVLLLTLSIGAVLRMKDMARQMELIVHVHSAKVNYANQMYNAARERVIALHSMLITGDIFERDDARMLFSQKAGEFIYARDMYLRLEPTDKELNLLTEAMWVIRKESYPAQKRTMELLVEDRLEDAKRSMIETTMPAQQRIVEVLTELVALQNRESAKAVKTARQAYQRSYWLVSLLGGAMFILSSGIAGFVIRRVRLAEKAMLAAKSAAENAARSKSDFLANMSHEIRTPLNAVIGMSEILQDSGLNATQRDYVNTIAASGSALLSIINDILDFSKIEAGRLELECRPFHLTQSIEEVLDLQAGKALEKGLDLVYQVDPQVPPVCNGDITRLRQILLNLLNNAIKFTQKGQVIVRVDILPHIPGTGDSAENSDDNDDEPLLHFSVEDSGIGIPKERIDALFTAFTQVDASTARKFGGTGLGLAICRHLCALMGGEIWVESEENKGTTFHFTLALPFSHDHSDANRREKLFRVLRGKTVLLVDDNPVHCHIVATHLSEWGLQVKAFHTSSAALATLWGGASYDLAIIKRHMPVMDGLTLAGKIHKHPAARTLPVIVSASLHQMSDTHPEVTLFVSRPIKFTQLLEKTVALFSDEVVSREETKTAYTDPGQADRFPLKILMAEDNRVNQKVALLMLNKLGYSADIANNGLEALQQLEQQTYDLVLMDMQMPEMDGLQAAGEIVRRWPKQERPYILAMTANVMVEDQSRCLAAGMQGHIAKPVQLQQLSQKLAECYKTRYPESFAAKQNKRLA